MRNLIDITDLTNEELQRIIDVACDIIAHPVDYREKCRGKKLATLFFEPSTRTRLSFEAAMYELGGNVIGFSDAGSSSIMKGESLADTAKVIGSYADVIAMRHPKDGSALLASEYAGVPLINAGDGGHCHPTQTLADLLTIYRAKGGFDNLTVGFCGDLKYGRTVHSLITALSRYKNVRIVLISPEELKLPDHFKTGLFKDAKMEYKEVGSLNGVMGEIDVLYMTRIQRERFSSPEYFADLADDFMLDKKKMESAKPDTIVLHPLPRVDEIAVDVDDDIRAKYFEQVRNGKYMRMSLILFLLDHIDDERKNSEIDIVENRDIRCANRRCVTLSERTFKHLFFKKENGKLACRYCETEV